MQRNRQPSEQTLAVLRSLALDPTEWRHGYDLCQETGLKAGTLYPILIRLADRNWLETTWETRLSAGRPPRHLYRLSETGLGQAREAGVVTAPASKAKRLRLRPRMGES